MILTVAPRGNAGARGCVLSARIVYQQSILGIVIDLIWKGTDNRFRRKVIYLEGI